MKRIYLAGPFSWQTRIRAHAEELQRLGYTITAEWLDQSDTFTNSDNSTNTKLAGLHATCDRLSRRDLCNIIDADTLVLFEPGIPLERNTRVAEFGVALALGRQCIVIGPEDEDKKDVLSSIFVMLENVEDWAGQNELSKIKPVMRFQKWEHFHATLFRTDDESTDVDGVIQSWKKQ